jgi:hypothetical protein
VPGRRVQQRDAQHALLEGAADAPGDVQMGALVASSNALAAVRNEV